MKLAREGVPAIVTGLAISGVSALAAAFAGGIVAGMMWAIAVLSGVAALFLLNFFRDPDRTAPSEVGGIVSPADGRILVASSDVDEPRFLGQRVAQVSIFMSPLDVHVNRAPIDGEVLAVHYHPGKYLAAFSEKSSLDNEQNAIVMKAGDGRSLVFIQIAGFLARRIVCRLTAGDRCARGDRIGMIKLGSRVDVFVPPPVTLRVKPGDRVRAGETILGVLQ